MTGLPFVFVRLTGCHQRCVYCDTAYAFKGGEKKTVQNILDEVSHFPCRHVLITGGEPLLQANTPLLAQSLLDKGYVVSIETSGNRDVSVLPPAVIVVMDLKTPGSHEEGRNNYANIDLLKPKDEVKFVVTDEGDVRWSLAKVSEFSLTLRCHVSMSPTAMSLHPVIAKHILESGLNIRQQTQLHKIIWPERDRGY